MNQKTAIVWCVDDNEKYNVMTLHSVFCAREHDKQSSFFILTLSNNNYSKLYKLFINTEVIFVDDLYENNFKKLSAHVNDNLVSQFTYCRFLILNIDVFKQYDRVLYLDCDSFMKKPIDDLFNIEMQNSNIQVMLVPEINTNDFNLKLLKIFCDKHNFKYDAKQYGNSGVILFVMKNIRKTDYENILKLVSLQFPIQEQGITNYYFQKNMQFIDSSFNSLIETCRNKDCLSNCTIRQYSGNEKDNILINAKKQNATLQNVISKLQKNIDQQVFLYKNG